MTGKTLSERLRSCCSCNIDSTPCGAEDECRAAFEAADALDARDAEIALLRHALKKIAALEPDWTQGVDHNMEQIQQIARKVLFDSTKPARC